MLELTYPSVYLFNYSLKERLGVSTEKNQKSYQTFLESIAQNLSQSIKISLSPDRLQDFKDIDCKEVADLKFRGTLNNHAIKGRYHRWALEDSYALLFDAYIEEKYNAQQVDSLIASLKLLTIDQPNIQSLGQTWIVSGVLESGTDDEIKILVESVYKNLISSNGAQYQEKGDFLGVKLYQFWRSTPNPWEQIDLNSHLIVILYPDRETQKAGAGLYQELMQVLLCRHKIVWAYENSKQLKTKLIQLYNEVSFVDDFSKMNLNQLMKYLKKISQFLTGLNTLDIHLKTVKINLQSYDRYRDYLEKNADRLGERELKFLPPEFSQYVRKKYIKQIEEDAASFRRCLEANDRLTDTIRNFIELRQAQHDRRFKEVAGTIAIGLGTGVIVASATSSSVEDIQASPLANFWMSKMPLFEQWSPLQLVLGLSILCGSAASLVTALIIAGLKVVRR